MRDQLIQYVELLFAGAKDSEDIKQEILQNTLDRYDDLIAEGKVPEAAYRLAITGIGDLSEILGTGRQPEAAPVRTTIADRVAAQDSDTPAKKLGRAIAVGLYIICALPILVLDELFDWDVLGVCCTLVIVAVATVIMILCKKEDDEEEKETNVKEESPLRRSIRSLIWAIGLVVYFVLSFYTRAWYITWLCFPIIGAVNGLVTAILDLKEVR